MAQLQVTVNKLNRRKSPVLDFADKTNVVEIVTTGFILDSVTQIENSLGIWHGDKNGIWVWEKALIKIPSDTNYPWWMTDLQVPMIWETYDEKGKNAKIAILDTGYNINNFEIKDNVANEHISILNPSVPVEINDLDGHGSLCASLIAAKNRSHTVGCAPESKLYVAKISNQEELRYQFLIDGVKWAIQQKVDIISISYGAQRDDEELHNIIKEAVIKQNILVVASIGNNLPELGQAGGDFPALYIECLAVGATNKFNEISPVTKLNEKTEINAPGEDIFSYVRNNTPEGTPNGTSQATAIVAGICGLIISRHKKLNKSYTTDSIKALLTENFDFVKNSTTQKLISPAKIFLNF